MTQPQQPFGEWPMRSVEMATAKEAHHVPRPDAFAALSLPFACIDAQLAALTARVEALERRLADLAREERA